MGITLSITNNGQTRAQTAGEKKAHLLYVPKYQKGDAIQIRTDRPGFFRIRLEDTMETAVVYLDGTAAIFPIPFGVDRAGYSPRSFTGKKHLVTVEAAGENTDGAFGKKVRNLAFNPYDGTMVTGMYPHASTNVTYADSLRNKIFPDRGLFAPRNAVDGFTFNESHRLYPFQSFGVNRMPDAWLEIAFGRAVDLTGSVFYLRCEFPHDTCWTSAELVFCHADDTRTSRRLQFAKSAEPQRFDLAEENVVSVRMQKMTMPENDPGFAGLAEIELYGREHLPHRHG